MEIHEPEGKLDSWAEVFKHLAIVTAGILIALGMEACIEWHHHRELVKEARFNIAEELHDNQSELQRSIGHMAGTEAQLHELMHSYESAIESKKVGDKRLVVDYDFVAAQLSTTSWTTAERTGALSYMSYKEIKDFAGIYDAQREYMELQQQMLLRVLDSSEYGNGADALERERQRLGAVDRVLHGLRALSASLNQRYAAAPAVPDNGH